MTPISIHALLAESDGSPCMIWSNIFLFLSTLSLRRATVSIHFVHLRKIYFYPRSPCGERRAPTRKRTGRNHFYPRSPCGERRFQFSLLRFRFFISIHALLAESDIYGCWMVLNRLLFLSTLSLRRATHPLRQLQSALCNFYPRSPCGERQNTHNSGETT